MGLNLLNRGQRFDSYSTGVSLHNRGSRTLPRKSKFVGPRTGRFDAYTLGAVERSLEYVEQEVQREEFAALPFAEGKLVPLDILNKKGIRFTTYRMITRIGKFMLHRSYSTSVPMIGVLSQEITQAVHKFVGGYYLSDDDIDAMDVAGMPIEQEEVAAVREAAMQEQNELIAFGRPELDMYGFLNHPNFLHTFLAAGFSSNFSSNAILGMLHDMVSKQVTYTKQVEKPDTMLLAPNDYYYIAGARVDNTLNTTILKQFLDTSPHIRNVEPVNECEGAGVDGTNIVVSYQRDKKKVKAMIIEDFAFLPLQREGLGYQRPGKFRYGGLRPYRPYSVHIGYAAKAA
jgi:hypothetical protein